MMIFGVDPSCAIALVLAIVFIGAVLFWLRANPITTVTQTDPDTDGEAAQDSATSERATMYELPTLNGWSAIHTGQHLYAQVSPADRMTPAEAAEFVALLEAADRDDPPLRRPKTHCPLCIITICDEWGIPLDETRVVGASKLCRKHRHFDLARARQGA